MEPRLDNFFKKYSSHVSNQSFEDEYQEARILSDLSEGYRSRLTQPSPGVNNRNRYTDIRCLDESRVHLKGRENDYINASHIKAADVPNAPSYIAAQAPLAHTIEDFWHMCWEEAIPVILMVTPFQEKSNGHVRTKAQPYFPMQQDTEETYGEYSVKCVNEVLSPFPGCAVRSLLLQNGESTREVAHIHFENWPDFGQVSDFDGVVKLMQLTDQAVGASDSKGPVLVHCSAGVGRTGTYIALDVVRRQIQYSLEGGKSDEPIQVDILGVVSRLRNERPAMVVTAGQYEMIYHGIYYMFGVSLGTSMQASQVDSAAATGAADDEVYKKLLS